LSELGSTKTGHTFRIRIGKDFLRLLSDEWACTRVGMLLNHVSRGEAPERAFVTIKNIRQEITDVEEIIEYLLRKVREAAKEDGITVYWGRRSCQRPTCGTCMGVFKAHYPYILTKEKGKTRTVRTRELRTFLLRYLSEEEVRIFEFAVDYRHTSLRIHNYYVRTYETMDFFEVELPEEVEEVE